MSNRSIALLFCGLLAISPPIHATEILLGRRPVELELDATRITITITAGEHAARLESHTLFGGGEREREDGGTGDGPGSAVDDGHLEVDYGDRQVSVRRPLADANSSANGIDVVRPRLEVQVWIAADQQLRLFGSDLQVTLIGQHDDRVEDGALDHDDGRGDEGFADEGATSAQAQHQVTPSERHDPNPPFTIELGVASSTVDLTGIADAAVALSGSRLRAEDTHGALTIVADAGSESEVLQHDGMIDLRATGSDSVIVGANGQIVLDLVQANLLVREGQGPVQGTAQGGLVVIEQRQGPTTIEATETVFELRATGSHIKLRGSALRVTGEDGRGAIEIESDRGGTVSLRDWVGRTTITQSGDGTFECTNLRGPLLLDLREGMRATVTAAESLVQASLRDAELTVAGAQALKINSQRSILRASEIRRLERSEVVATELDLDLQDTQSFGPLRADGTSRLRLAMRAPCRVVVSGGASRDGGHSIRANRCFVDLASQVGKTYSPRARGTASVVHVELAEGGHLDVEGHSP